MLNLHTKYRPMSKYVEFTYKMLEDYLSNISTKFGFNGLRDIDGNIKSLHTQSVDHISHDPLCQVTLKCQGLSWL